MSSGRSSSTKSEDRNTTRIREIQNGCIDNKRCFDCRQRGPNYVNVTVGSFVCTKCSGMLRGVTPPHRIKSISMSTFTNEDVSLLDSRGNLWCQKVWLATYSGSMAEDFTASGDETLKTHILDKYEKKRYYIDPTTQKDLDLFSSSHLRQSLIEWNFFVIIVFNTPTQTTPNITTTPTFSHAFANFETATFEPPPADPLRLFRSTTPSPCSNHNYTASSTSRTSSVVSPTMNSNTSTTSEDRYAALKDLDEIFRSVHVSETNDTMKGRVPFLDPSTMIILLCLEEPIKSWKRLSTNSSDNQGWATFGSTTTPSSSSSSSTNTASNPFNLGPTNFSH
ncbi:AGFG1 [Lepeophtheirus salmonis]|uniref:AGFG1 n=1 Tax=Lepeophtheirus salmonis TaxID=72036 RepID=A0A7R8CKB9_LEPSM|nr:AGFG1 [Lepeophtheirus salmonis]CAF2848293.1 AGFG1 [Lepeophtheirus salmonis]